MRHHIVKCPVHIIIAVREMAPVIGYDIESRFFSYIGGICKNLDCLPIRVGGHRDHVHIFCNLSQHVSLVRLITDIKQYSSQWLRKMDKKYKDFFWQEGFGVFSVDVAEADVVGHYIAAQKEHHHEKTFEEEWQNILSTHGVGISVSEPDPHEWSDCDLSAPAP